MGEIIAPMDACRLRLGECFAKPHDRRNIKHSSRPSEWGDGAHEFAMCGTNVHHVLTFGQEILVMAAVMPKSLSNR